MTLTPVLRLVFLFSVALIALATRAELNEPTTNLVHNAGFEEDTANWGLAATNGAEGDAIVDSDVRHNGKKSLRLTNKTTLAPNVFYRAFQSMQGIQPYTT